MLNLSTVFTEKEETITHSPVSDLTASNYWNKLFTLYPQSSSYYKRQPQLKNRSTSSSSSSSESDSNKKSKKSVSESVKNQKREVDKKSDDNASPASL